MGAGSRAGSRVSFRKTAARRNGTAMGAWLVERPRLKTVPAWCALHKIDTISV
jgi:hypothetical protein